jgi:hypothetical protein
MHVTLPVGAQGRGFLDDLGGLDAEASQRGSAQIELDHKDGFSVASRNGVFQTVHVY